MTTKNAAQIYKKLEQAQAQQERQKAKSDPKAFISLAVARGYGFTVQNFKTQLSHLSDEDVAGAVKAAVGASDPSEDNRGPVEFKKHAASVVIRCAIERAIERA